MSDVTYVVALIAIVAIAVLCWKAFGPEQLGGATAPRPRFPQRKRAMGPDDDPEFLWNLSRQQHREGESGPTES